MKRLVLLTALVLSLAACKPPEPWSPETDIPPQAQNASAQMPVKTVLTAEDTKIGDAEQGIHIEATIPSATLPPNVSIEAIENRRDRLSIVNVTIAPPGLEKLEAEFEVVAKRVYATEPVVLRAHVMAEDQQVGEINGVYGADAKRHSTPLKFDLLANRATLPKSFLVTVVGELLVMPTGTDPATIDIATAQSEKRSEALDFNPIRVTFTDDALSTSDASATDAPAADPTATSETPGINVQVIRADQAAPAPAPAEGTPPAP